MNVESIVLWAAVIVSIANLVFSLWRTYYARYAKKTYQGSVDYWASWQNRKFDVAAEILKEMVDSPKDVKKILRKLEKKKREGSKKTRRNKN